MKLWKLVLVAMLFLCVCMSVLADEGTDIPHECSPTEIRLEPTCNDDGVLLRWSCQDPTCPKSEELIPIATLPATGHTFEDVIILVPTCTTDGTKNIVCANGCGYEELDVIIKAEGHKGKWIVVTPATPEAEGEAKKICSVCEEELDSKAVPYKKMLYSNTATSFGPTTRELVGGDIWYRVTPLDLTAKGTFTYPLVASNRYVIGTVTVTVSEDSFSVNYKAVYHVDVTAEKLLVYADKAALAAGTAESFEFGDSIAIGEDTNVILSVVLVVNYDTIGYGVSGFSADKAQIEAMKAMMD